MTRVRIGTSRIHWQGLFAAQAIRKGTRIIEYTGEKIPWKEGERRLLQGNAYIFQLNVRYAIDGKALTNLARYINHSCAPNCASDIIRGHIWIIALRDIQDGEELSYDYGYGLEGYEHRPYTCGATQCCGYILDRPYWGHIKRTRQQTEDDCQRSIGKRPKTCGFWGGQGRGRRVGGVAAVPGRRGKSRASRRTRATRDAETIR
jgi:hypothetical protein